MKSELVDIVDNNEVEIELDKLVDVLKTEIPSLFEVRVFGSYNNGNWDKERSDIDIFVLLTDENYYSKKSVRNYDYTSLESELREELRGRIKKRFKSKYSRRVSLYLCTPADAERLRFVNDGRGNFGENMLEGRLIYKK